MSNAEYPKMLYSGDKESYSSRIAHTTEEERQFREIGLIDYADLPEPQSELTKFSHNTDEYSAVVRERDAALARVDELELIIKKGIAENNALRDELAAYQVVDSAPPVGYSDMTVKQLQDEIKKAGKTFKSSDTKAELIAILES